MLEEVRARVDAWCADAEVRGESEGYPFEWREILSGTPETIARRITAPGPEMDRLRSSTPFPSPMTDPDHRRRLWRKIAKGMPEDKES